MKASTDKGDIAHFKIGGVIGDNGGNHNHYANQKKWFVNHKNPIILMRDCDLIGKMRLDANVWLNMTSLNKIFRPLPQRYLQAQYYNIWTHHHLLELIRCPGVGK